MAERQRVVLDTHVWIWLVDGNSQLLPRIRVLIDDAARMGAVLIPAICVWEVATLELKGRLVLQKDPRDWVREALNQPGISLVPHSAEIALDSCYLPGDLHQDPADRLIVATARIENAVVVTRDRRLLRYAKDGHVSAVRA